MGEKIELKDKYDFIQFRDQDRFGEEPKRFKEYIIPDVYPMKDVQLESFINQEINNKNIWRTKQQFMNRNRNVSLVVTKNSILYICAIKSGRQPVEREKYIREKCIELAMEWF